MYCGSSDANDCQPGMEAESSVKVDDVPQPGRPAVIATRCHLWTFKHAVARVIAPSSYVWQTRQRVISTIPNAWCHLSSAAVQDKVRALMASSGTSGKSASCFWATLLEFVNNKPLCSKHFGTVFESFLKLTSTRSQSHD